MERGPWESRKWSLDCGGTGPQAGEEEEAGGREDREWTCEGTGLGGGVMADLLPEKFLLLKREARPGSRATCFCVLFLVSVLPPAQ